MKKNSTVTTNRNKIFKEPKLTIGLDLGDRTSYYCILDEAGNVILEQSLPTTPKGIHQVFNRIPRSRIALETGTHSPWVSRQLLKRVRPTCTERKSLTKECGWKDGDRGGSAQTQKPPPERKKKK